MIMDNKKKIIITSAVLGLLIAGCLTGAVIHNSPAKNNEIYKEALADMSEENYSNAYYLFSKVGFLSALKPLAIYHQAECADRLGDTEAAVKQYKFLFKLYPRHILSVKAKYLAAQDLVEKNPKRAKKYFDQIIKHYPDTDYAIAAEYYSGLLLMKKYTQSVDAIFPRSEKDNVESHFRHYLKKAPSGRLALNVVNSWLSLDKPISKDDYLLMAKTYYLFNDFAGADKMLKNVDIQEAWPLEVLNADGMGNSARVKYLTEWGLKDNANYVEKEDIYKAVDVYIKHAPSKYEAADKLYNLSHGKGKDYIWDLKCSYALQEYKNQCYKNLYLTFPKGDFADDALSQVFLAAARSSDAANAKKIGHDFLNKFKKSIHMPMVIYWMGRLYEKTNDYRDYMSYYRNVIAKYPDNYYAYRAYLHLNHTPGPIITSYIKEAPVLYPYKTKPAIIDRLVKLEDFSILEEYAQNDEFLESWILYEKGDYWHSMVVARDAMEALAVKPDKYDLRWRLVYPVHYYSDIKKYADNAGNNPPLMLAIAREESYFNPDAKSAAGASGLMQLMPATASEIAAKHGVKNYNLFNPQHNLMLGNYYYAFIKSMLSGMDVSSIAAYNGGVGSVNSWQKSIFYNDTDEFVEQIPYPETQYYVKKVFRSYWNYIRIYNGNSE